MAGSCGFIKVTVATLRSNKRMQRRPRSEFLIVPRMFVAAPLMRGVGPLCNAISISLNRALLILFFFPFLSYLYLFLTPPCYALLTASLIVCLPSLCNLSHAHHHTRL
jgi:hypothetical protein